MLFGTNPWSGGGAFARRQPAMRPPTQMQPLGQPVQPQPAYPAPTWPGQTPDGTYSTGLAGYYANQLQNQQVPGSVMAPPSPAPVAAPVAAPPMPGQSPGGWRDAFHSALATWRQGFDPEAMNRKDYRQLRPERGDYRMGGM